MTRTIVLWVILFGSLNVFAQTDQTRIDSSETDLTLEFNYKPFQNKHEIHYCIPMDSHVTLAIKDGTGKEVKKIVDGHHQAGRYHIQCRLEMPASGVYYCKLLAGKFQCTHAIAFLK